MAGMNVDVAVVGGGIIGCAVARCLARDGASVSVVEADPDPRHASWAAAGMLAPQAESTGSGPFLDLLLRARDRFPALESALLQETGSSIGYRTEGMLLLAFTTEDESEFDERFHSQTGAGLSVQRLSRSEVLGLEPYVSPNVRGGLFFEGDHQVENRLLHAALRRSATDAGCTFLHERVVGLRPEGTEMSIGTAGGGTISASTVVLAAGSWSNEIQGLPRSIPVRPVHGELLSVDSGGRLRGHVLASYRGYLVPRDGQVIVGATAADRGFEEHTTLAGLATLAAGAAEICPSLGGLPMTAHWAGLRPGTPDELPILGRDPDVPALIYATGHYRNGILLAPITGEIVSRLAMGEDPGLDLAPYRPDRFS